MSIGYSSSCPLFLVDIAVLPLFVIMLLRVARLFVAGFALPVLLLPLWFLPSRIVLLPFTQDDRCYTVIYPYICRHDYGLPSLSPSISPSSGMDTYMTYKLQRTLRVSRFIIHPFLFADTQNVRKRDTGGAGAGKPQKSWRQGTMCPCEIHSRNQGTRLYCDTREWYKQVAITKRNV